MDTKNESPAVQLLLEIMKQQETKNPELKAKQLQLLEHLAGRQQQPAEAKPGASGAGASRFTSFRNSIGPSFCSSSASKALRALAARKTARLGIWAAALLVVAPMAHAAYTITDLGTPNGGISIGTKALTMWGRSPA
jgi:hypothetical protein